MYVGLPFSFSYLPVMQLYESKGAVFMRLILMNDIKINQTSVTSQMGMANAQYLTSASDFILVSVFPKSLTVWDSK